MVVLLVSSSWEFSIVQFTVNVMILQSTLIKEQSDFEGKLIACFEFSLYKCFILCNAATMLIATNLNIIMFI